MAKRTKPPAHDPVTAYALAVRDEREIAGRFVRLACERHLRDIKEQEARGLVWKPQRAQEVIDFFEGVLVLPDVDQESDDNASVRESIPFVLQPFQKFIVGSLYGWYRTNETRRFRVAYVEAGKGSGKTPLAAGLGLYALLIDGGKGAQIYAAAVTEKQAKLAFVDAENMVKASDDLSEMVDSTVNNLAVLATGSFFRPISSEKRGLDGKRVFMAIVDELHEHPKPIVVQKVRAGTKGRKNALIFEITNSGYDRTSVCWQHHEYSRQILEQSMANDAWFAYMCGLDEGDKWDVEGPHWLKANPGLGTTLTWDYLREQVQEAKGMPANENIVRRLNFCEWTTQNTRAIQAPQWAACSELIPDSVLETLPCYGGIDLGQTDDFSALVLIWLLEDKRIAVRCRFWIPDAAMEKYPGRPYDTWRQNGALEVTEGNITDYNVVQDAISEDCQRWGVREVAYDKRFAQQMALNLQGEGVTMVDTPQGFQLTESINKLQELIKAARLAHGGDSVLSWMASNVELRHGRDKQVRIDKEASGDKIDGISALVMAISRWIVEAPDDNQSSYYDSRGVLVI
jgi:phage terminase large subunit-like protein